MRVRSGSSAASGTPASEAWPTAVSELSRRRSARAGSRSTRSRPSTRSSTVVSRPSASLMAVRAAVARRMASVGRAFGRLATLAPTASSAATAPIPEQAAAAAAALLAQRGARDASSGSGPGGAGRRRAACSRRPAAPRPAAAWAASIASPQRCRKCPIASASGTGLRSGRPASSSCGRTGSRWWVAVVAATSTSSIASIPSEPAPPRIWKSWCRCSTAAVGRSVERALWSSSVPTTCATLRDTSAIRSSGESSPSQVYGWISSASPSESATRRCRALGSSSSTEGGGGSSNILPSRTITAAAGPSLATWPSRPRTTSATTLMPAALRQAEARALVVDQPVRRGERLGDRPGRAGGEVVVVVALDRLERLGGGPPERRVPAGHLGEQEEAPLGAHLGAHRRLAEPDQVVRVGGALVAGQGTDAGGQATAHRDPAELERGTATRPIIGSGRPPNEPPKRPLDR